MACCGRSARSAPPPNDFCGSLRISTGASLVGSDSAGWEVLVMHGAQKVDLRSRLSECANAKSTGARLGQVVLRAIAIAQVKGICLQERANRQMPLVLLKDYLFKAIGPCTSCMGRGCTACDRFGIV